MACGSPHTSAAALDVPVKTFAPCLPFIHSVPRLRRMSDPPHLLVDADDYYYPLPSITYRDLYPEDDYPFTPSPVDLPPRPSDEERGSDCAVDGARSPKDSRVGFVVSLVRAISPPLRPLAFLLGAREDLPLSPDVSREFPELF